jgi:metallo-beta-lactamase class B
VLHDGEDVKLGGMTLTAHLTAGHTKGCTTWTTKVQDAGKSYNVVIICSIGANPGYILVNNPDYPEIAADYKRSFQTLRALPCDIYLGSHAAFYGMAEKYAKLEKAAKGDPNPFVDPEGYQAYINQMEKTLDEKVAAQRK